MCLLRERTRSTQYNINDRVLYSEIGVLIVQLKAIVDVDVRCRTSNVVGASEIITKISHNQKPMIGRRCDGDLRIYIY